MSTIFLRGWPSILGWLALSVTLATELLLFDLPKASGFIIISAVPHYLFLRTVRNLPISGIVGATLLVSASAVAPLLMYCDQGCGFLVLWATLFNLSVVLIGIEADHRLTARSRRRMEG